MILAPGSIDTSDKHVAGQLLAVLQARNPTHSRKLGRHSHTCCCSIQKCTLHLLAQTFVDATRSMDRSCHEHRARKESVKQPCGGHAQHVHEHDPDGANKCTLQVLPFSALQPPRADA
jgi:hypothetical protein